MKRSLGLLLLIASAVAGFALLRSGPTGNGPASTARPAAPAAETPQAVDAPARSAGSAATAPEAPPVVAEPGAAAAGDTRVVVVDAEKLRQEADRLIANGHALEGIEMLRQATAANPTAKNHGDLGSLLLRLTAVDEALVHLRQAAELDRRNPDRWVDLANAYYRKVDLGEAWKAERRARDAQPGLELKRGPNGLWLRPSDSGSANR